MDAIIILGIIGVFIWSQQAAVNKANAKREAQGRRYSSAGRYGPSGSKDAKEGRFVAESATKFNSEAAKASAFDRLISWAEQEATSQGKSFQRLAGKNDYQRARQVFQHSEKWKQLRRATLARYSSCLRCGTRSNLQVDHVVPMVMRPDMFNHESNLQTLCGACNRRKGVKAIDYRPRKQTPSKRVEQAPIHPAPRRRKPFPSNSEVPVISRYGDKSTAKQLVVKYAVSLNSEERREHEKRVAQEIVAERRAAQAKRQRLNRIASKRKVVTAKKD